MQTVTESRTDSDMAWRDMSYISADEAEAEPLEERLFYEPLSPARNPGYIYLMRMKATDDEGYYPCKIGKSKDVPNRAKQVGLVLPYDLDLVFFVAVDDMSAAERALHRLYEPYRLRGEWFRLPQEGIDQFVLCHQNGVSKLLLG